METKLRGWLHLADSEESGTDTRCYGCDRSIEPGENFIVNGYATEGNYFTLCSECVIAANDALQKAEG